MEARELTAAIWEMQNRIDLLETERRKAVCPEMLQNLIITAKQVAAMHGVSARTVQAYANAGRLPKHPSSTDGKMLFRASDAVIFDFPRLRESKRRPTTMSLNYRSYQYPTRCESCLGEFESKGRTVHQTASRFGEIVQG